MYIPDITREYPHIEPNESADAFTEAVQEVYEKFDVECPLHVQENGFEQGDASDEQIGALRTELHCADDEALYGKLNSTLAEIYRAKLREFEIVAGFNADTLTDKFFATTNTTYRGYHVFIPAGEDADEWGVEVVVLDEARDGNHTVAYRAENPMVDDEWKLGGLDDVAEGLRLQRESLHEFLEN